MKVETMGENVFESHIKVIIGKLTVIIAEKISNLVEWETISRELRISLPRVPKSPFLMGVDEANKVNIQDFLEHFFFKDKRAFELILQKLIENMPQSTTEKQGLLSPFLIEIGYQFEETPIGIKATPIQAIEKPEKKNVGANKKTDDELKRVFVVHGRNKKASDAMFDFITALGLHPLDWSEGVKGTGKGSPYIGDILDSIFSMAQAVVILMTPDDEGCLRGQYRGQNEPSHEIEYTPQPRLNVVFEAGLAFGRSSDRTILVRLGDIRPFSDVIGRHYVDLDNSMEKRQDLAQRLENAGCPVEWKQIKWLKVGDFESVIK